MKPQINCSGQIVWMEWDSYDYEVYSFLDRAQKSGSPLQPTWVSRICMSLTTQCKYISRGVNVTYLKEDSEENQKDTLNSKPSYDAFINKGDDFLKSGNHLEAIHCYRHALKINQNDATLYSKLGDAHFRLGNETAILAIEFYKKSLKIDSNNAENYNKLGLVLHDLGRQEEAIDSFKEALKVNPDFLRARFNLCVAQIPVIYLNKEDIFLSRERYRQELEDLRQFIRLNPNIDLKEVARGELLPFFLAYQGNNDRELQGSYGEIICSIMRARYPQFGDTPTFTPIIAGGQIRLGFVSPYFSNSVDWNFIIKGWVENLNKERFRLFAYVTSPRKDEQTEVARKNFSHFVEGIYSIKEMARIIRRDRLHVLIYPHAGRHVMTGKLAALKLAPIQCVAWGHPSTSGLPTIDYFLSKDLSEPTEAEFHYSERLVRLPNLSIYFNPPEARHVCSDRNSFGLPSDGILFYCGQSLCKYLPQYDEIFPRIAQALRKCHFVFKKDFRSPVITNTFKQRLSQAFTRYNLRSEEYITLLPKLDEEQYYGLFRVVDVFLDSIGYSGFVSTLDAIAFDIPIVTFQASLMRGRQSLGILTMMGIKATIVSTLDEYVSHAIKLGADSSWRRKMSGKIAENKGKLYRDTTCIKGLEAFLEEAVSQHMV